MTFLRRIAPLVAVAFLATSPGLRGQDLTEVTLEELANMRVTSVDKKAETLARTAAAVFIITQEDIRRSGATNLAEILRLAPGVEVARAESDHWAVGVRGFGDQFSKSVLVLIDGRSVYTPLFAGVDWPIQDTDLADVDRIEVIRGPGGTIWGANAVNGVINVITKKASATRGALVSAAGGTLDHALGQVRYGGGNGRGFDYRIYAKAFSRGPEFHVDGRSFDDWSAGQMGFRADWELRDRDELTLQGDARTGGYGQSTGVASFSPPTQLILDQKLDQSGGNVVARWRRRFSEKNDLQVQAYYDRNDARGPQYRETRDNFDLDVLHHFPLPGGQSVAWGVGARSSPSHFGQTVPTLDFLPHDQTTSLLSAFLQDEVALLGDRLRVTLGSKLERNNYTGVELQPSARFSWALGKRQALWGALSRAVRTPSRLEEDLVLTGFLAKAPLFYVEIDGNTAIRSETLLGYEAGYRALVTSDLHVDVAGFHNSYEDLVSFGAGHITADSTPEPAHLTLHFPYANGVEGTTDGVEVALDWKPVRSWHLRGSYSLLSFALRNQPGATDVSAVTTDEGSSPRHQVTLQSLLDLPARLELDPTFRYVSALPAKHVDAYATADVRLGWRVGRGFELAGVGQNLLQRHHAEFARDPGPTVEISRAAYAQLTWRR